MNSDGRLYPAALYSAVTEAGYRQERFTGEVLRSGRQHRGHDNQERHHHLLARLRTHFTVHPGS